jgi:deoxyribodipyrimidine photolyase-related protein
MLDGSSMSLVPTGPFFFIYHPTTNTRFVNCSLLNMTVGLWILGDQLSLNQAALHSSNLQKNPLILIESLDFIRQRPYHKQKLVLVWSAMRHFARQLQADGWDVTYSVSDDFETPLINWINTNKITELRVMKPADKPFELLVNNLNLPCKIKAIANNSFLWSESDFSQWADGRKRLLMEDFYREGRKRFNILMDGDRPLGGEWNFDKQNRKPPKQNLNPPPPLHFERDEIVTEVIAKVNSLKIPTYGKIEPFLWAVTRSQALQVLEHFVEYCLPNFGAYQDAMLVGQQTMWHSLLSPYINLGLLEPLEVIKKVEKAYRNNKNLPLNSVEGFIRQVLGWREYIRGVYFIMPPEYSERNFFQHDRPLPDFFWDAEKTDMNCLHQVLSQVEKTGYAHHIQRLMVLSNFALIAGLNPQQVENWFHAAFIDAFDWVMQTNVIGMGLFADGGVLASKPYAASANYIHKMSDYCRGCVYDRRDRFGPSACPFNFFYWDFLARHRDRLKSQGRMSFILANLDKMTPEQLQTIRQKAQEWHSCVNC